MSIKTQLKHKDEYCTEFVIKHIETVKKYFGISSSKRVYALDWWYDRYYFLGGDKIYAVYFDYMGDKYPYEPVVNSAYIITLKDGKISDFQTVKPDDTTPRFEKIKGVKIYKTRKILTEEHFKLWYESPVQVNEFVDVPHSKAIEFLQNYKKDTFNQGRYLFYAKRDNDFAWLYFIYAYDLLTKTELKIYVDSYIYTDFPEKLNEIYVKDLSGELSDYQILQCKKAFFKYCRGKCEELNAPNFYALEFVKQCIQPIEKDRGWAVNRPFLWGSEFDNIWIDDTLRYDEKPYFMVCNNNQPTITKIAVLDFYKPEYKSTEPYINAFMKRNHWDIDRTTLERLVKFLKAPYGSSKLTKITSSNKDYGNGKTNWQRLIELYNENTAQYNKKYEKLPLDLPLPDYTKLKSSNNENT